VAFVRFASVYRDFREVRDFSAVIDELESGGDGAVFAQDDSDQDADDPEKA
jgi:transcriptional repressor NrdR